MLLAIETASDICSVALKKGDELFEKRSETKNFHSENLFLFIEELMKEHSFSVSNLDAILVSEGPGSYTGLRIAASAVKGLLFEQKIPLFGVNTLASFAMSAEKSHQRIHSIIDARRKHLYHQKFTLGERLKAESSVEVITIEHFVETVEENDVIIGTGLNRINEKVRKKAVVFGKEYITAKSLIKLYQTSKSFINEVKAEQFEPKYYTSNQVMKR